MSKLLNNLPIENLTVENDYLGIIDKGEIIKTFLESNTDEFKDIKMFSLYGEWGSGKSTLMKYLQKELKGSFNTFFFEAWQFESDSNLSLSLLEYLSYKSSDSTDEALGELVEIAAKLFRGFSKSVRISVPGLSIEGNKIVESLEEKPEETFYQLKKKFETEFRKWESHATKGKNPKFNIVFIDDLDRCEPENVLNLLSALKLFFTYGEKTVFFCGIDKKAVHEAVKTKYGAVVMANEYLEKIFDISFSMPVYDNLFRLVSQYFGKEEVRSIGGSLNENISNFLVALNFTNPRRVKKLLNKYLMLSVLKESQSLQTNFPNIYTQNEGNYYETILSLYFMILHEFYPNRFDDLFNFKKKEINYYNAIYGGNIDGQKTNISGLMDNNISSSPFSRMKGLEENKSFQFIAVMFLPNDVESIKSGFFRIDSYMSIKLKNKNIEFRFVDYIARSIRIINKNEFFSECSPIQLRQIIRNVL